MFEQPTVGRRRGGDYKCIGHRIGDGGSCDDYQGNFLAKPLMASEFIAMVAGAKETVE